MKKRNPIHYLDLKSTLEKAFCMDLKFKMLDSSKSSPTVQNMKSEF